MSVSIQTKDVVSLSPNPTLTVPASTTPEEAGLFSDALHAKVLRFGFGRATTRKYHQK
jgi:hypothetical protein